jgi:hypothetical protein
MSSKVGRFASIGIVVVFAFSCSSDDDAETTRRSRCLRLRDHVIELRLVTQTNAREKHRAAMRDALGEEFVSHCESEITSDRLNCMLSAKDHDTVSKCK